MAECHQSSQAQSFRALDYIFTTSSQSIWSSYCKVLFIPLIWTVRIFCQLCSDFIYLLDGPLEVKQLWLIKGWRMRGWTCFMIVLWIENIFMWPSTLTCVFLSSRLALYVYEYLLHVGAQKSAQTFLSEVRNSFTVTSCSNRMSVIPLLLYDLQWNSHYKSFWV